jgi:hypothetical protein
MAQADNSLARLPSRPPSGGTFWNRSRAFGVGPTDAHAKKPIMRRGHLDNPELNPTEARQGFLGRPVLVVLAGEPRARYRRVSRAVDAGLIAPG